MSNLVALLQASGQTGTAGQSFAGHAAGSPGAGIGMLDYRLNGATWSGTPTTPFPTYADDTPFDIVATFSRGSMFHHIQRNILGAWAVSVTGGAGASASLSNFSAGGSPAGATHSLRVAVRGAYSGSPGVSPNFSLNEPADPLFDPWPVTWISGVSGGTPSGTSTLTLQLTYSPDTGGFNQALVQAWDLVMNNRAYEMEVRWFRTLADYNNDVNPVATSENFTPIGIAGIYPTSDDGLLYGESATLYLKYRSVGASWTNYGAVTASYL